MLLPTRYLVESFAEVLDLNDFYRGKLPEIIKIKSLIGNIKILLNVPQDRIQLSVVEGDRVYKITTLSSDIHKIPFAEFVYLPLQNRLDIFSTDQPQLPLIQYKAKKAVFKNYSTLLDRAGLDKIFMKLVNVI